MDRTSPIYPTPHWRVGSSDFGTLTYKTDLNCGKNSKSNYKIRFSLYLTISCEMEILVLKK
jgi:hypothetical protein